MFYHVSLFSAQCCIFRSFQYFKWSHHLHHATSIFISHLVIFGWWHGACLILFPWVVLATAVRLTTNVRISQHLVLYIILSALLCYCKFICIILSHKSFSSWSSSSSTMSIELAHAFIIQSNALQATFIQCLDYRVLIQGTQMTQYKSRFWYRPQSTAARSQTCAIPLKLNDASFVFSTIAPWPHVPKSQTVKDQVTSQVMWLINYIYYSTLRHYLSSRNNQVGIFFVNH